MKICFRTPGLLFLSICCVAVPLLVSSMEISAAPRNPFRRGAQPSDGTVPHTSGTEPNTAGTEPNTAGTVPKETTEEVTVKLNYLKASWSRVLKDYADATNTELVADRVPSKTFSRMDLKRHSPKDALKILNQSLEPEGYRLQQMGNHMVLVEIRRTNAEYPRYGISRPQDRERERERERDIEQAADWDSEPRHHTQVQDIRRRSDEDEDEGESDSPRHNRRSVIRQLSGEVDAEKSDARRESLTTTVVRLRSRDSVAVARTIYNAFKPHVELLEEGPQGLQGFRVFQAMSDKTAAATTRRRARFSVGIDEEHNRLVVEATQRETRSVIRLIEALDMLSNGDQSSIQAVPTSHDAAQLASALQPELNRLSEAARKATRRTSTKAAKAADETLAAEEAAAGQEPENRESPEGPPPKRQPSAPPGETTRPAPLPQALIDTLKGDVSVEAVPDLGILILRGNEKDVESVMSVIKEIEKMSVGTALDVELRMLKNVDSESLATLLRGVYERLGAGRSRGLQSQGTTVIPIARPNAILILAGAADMDTIIGLSDELDQPTDPSAEFRVFRLKYAVASQVVEAVQELYPASEQQQQTQQATQIGIPMLVPKVRIVADARTNTVIVQARPQDMREVALMIRNLDSSDSATVNLLKIFPLENAVADEMALTLQLAIQSVLNPPRITAPQGGGQFGGGAGAQGAGQSSPELTAVKSTILQYLDGQGPDARVVRSGILSDIRVTSDVRTNSLVVTAPEQSMELVAQLIKRLDKPAAAVSEIKVFSLANSDASAMAQLLERLFGVQQSGQRGGQGGQGGGLAAGIQVAGADDASSTLIPLRFSVDIRTNSIIAIGGGEALRVVEAVLLRLDESDIRQRQNTVYKLKNSPALNVSQAISQFLQSQRQVEQIDPGLVSPFEQIEREVVVVPEEVSNSLLISATPRYFKEIIALVEKLDEAPKQVIVQAMLVEVTLDNTDEWGVELGLQDSILFDRSVVSQLVQVATTNTSPNGVQTTTQNIVSQSSDPGYLFNSTQPLGNNTSSAVDSGRVGSQGLTNFNVGRVNSDLGYGGLVLSAGSESVNVLLRALAARRRVDVLSRPQITTLDNQIAQIQVGQEIPRVNGFTVNQQTGYAAPLVQPRSVGIILEVTPRISPEGKVVMNIVARKDALNPVGVPLFINPNGSTVTSPIIDTTNALATVSVNSGQTIVLGGMITKTDDVTERRVPFISDIPLLGELFRYDLKKMRRTELLVFLTPRITRNDAEMEFIKEVESRRLHFIEEEAEMIHGPLFGVPAESDWVGPGAPSESIPYVAPPELAPAEGSPPPLPPVPLPPKPMLFDDPSVPTTIMPSEPAQMLPPPPESGPAIPPMSKTPRKSKLRQAQHTAPARQR